jgi:hypothetical protein
VVALVSCVCVDSPPQADSASAQAAASREAWSFIVHLMGNGIRIMMDFGSLSRA